MIDLKVIGKPTIFGDLVFLENFRFANGRKLPFSYRAFVKKYGYGKALGQWYIYIPMGDYGDSWTIINPIFKERFDVVLNWEHNIVEMVLKPDGTRQLIRQAEPFGKSESGEYLFWNIHSQPSEDEFDIYVTDFSGLGVRKVAASLDELFEKMTSPNGFNKTLPYLCEKPFPAIFECIERLHY